MSLPLHVGHVTYLFLQSSSDQPTHLSQRPGAAVPGWQHLHHLLCGGAFSEAGAGEARADAVGEERGNGRHDRHDRHDGLV